MVVGATSEGVKERLPLGGRGEVSARPLSSSGGGVADFCAGLEIGEEDRSNWLAIREKLRQTYGEAIFRSWLRSLILADISGGTATLYAPTPLVRDWVSSHYLETMRRFWNLRDGGVHRIELVVLPSSSSSSSSTAVDGNAVGNVGEGKEEEGKRYCGNGVSSSYDEDIIRHSSALDPRYTFSNFVVGKPNELAFAAAKRVAESPDLVPGCNPLFLYGGVGLGKTHLMHAIAWHIRSVNPRRKVMYLSAEKFMYQFIRALRYNEAIAFKEQFRSVDVLMVDDVQFMSGKESTQEEFFHTFNALVDQNKQLVISADRSPSDIEGLEDRVKSRLGWGLVADINACNYELRLGILQAKAEKIDSAIHVPTEVFEFLASKITTNIRELEGALNRIIAHATLIGRDVTLDTTMEILKDLLRTSEKRVTVEEIQKAVANHYNIKISEMHSSRRAISVARPRQIAMYLSKKLTTKSFPEIGRKFGGKDHSTVLHAVKRVEELAEKDIEIREDIELLSKMLQG